MTLPFHCAHVDTFTVGKACHEDSNWHIELDVEGHEYRDGKHGLDNHVVPENTKTLFSVRHKKCV